MDINARIAARLSALRRQRGLSLEALAQQSDVSRSMISLIERGESSPTAAVLEKLAYGLGMPLNALFEVPATDSTPLVRHDDQPRWQDPQSGYIRRNLTPDNAHFPVQMIEVIFPAGASVAYETGQRDPGIHQQIWLLAGSILIRVGEREYRLRQGDCLGFALDRPTAFHNPHHEPARYLVLLSPVRSVP
ncbi:XRE family transcriptional regulator [Candidatus Sodalis pierantonius str. SOPE]|uniref:XRE family transcriptional regulator n=1 Tax=Candidatus Sodalis pierantonii str. SOPE TaxID=2342 RepID=W0HLA1_9GAMM|nr:XRE family transcriptional regulator [Candidatus Sodalis pierantonius]AHF74676.1 XRE family transcriptional regulator [Candidatus Sodalis pierantonius str. SOPE]